MHWIIKILIIAGIITIMVGCNLPAEPVEETQNPEVVYTQAAQTIVAQLTQIATGVNPDLETRLPDENTQEPGLGTVPEESAMPHLEPSNTPTSVETSTGTPTSTNTPIPSSEDPRTYLGDADWKDDLNNSNNWSLYDDEHVRFRIKDGVLVMVALNADGRDSWMVTWPQPENFYLEMTAQMLACNGADRFGFIFRSDAAEGYLVGITCDGQFGLRTWDGEKFSSLVDWSESGVINTGTEHINRIGVLVKDDDIEIFINGVPHAKIQDDSYSEGGFGVFIGAKETDNLRVEVDQIIYWELP